MATITPKQREWALEAALQGATISEISSTLGFSLSTWYAIARADPSFAEEVRAAREEHLDSRLTELDQMITRARDPLELAKMRERGVHLRWLASKRIAAYGDRVTVDISAGVDIRQSIALAERRMAAITVLPQKAQLTTATGHTSDSPPNGAADNVSEDDGGDLY